MVHERVQAVVVRVRGLLVSDIEWLLISGHTVWITTVDQHHAKVYTVLTEPAIPSADLLNTVWNDLR